MRAEHDLKEGRKERRHKEKSPEHPSEIALLSQVISAPCFAHGARGPISLTKYVLRSVKDDLGEERCR